MKNINKEVWRYIDNNVAVKKNLYDGIINVRALAKKIIQDLHLNCSLNAVISAIRRYEIKVEKTGKLKEKYHLLTDATLNTKTKLASILLKKNELVRKNLTKLFTKIDFESGDVLRIFEVSKVIKIIVDEKTLEVAKDLFNRKDIIKIEKNIGELSIIYNSDITKIPGLFALLSNELAGNNISIVDSMICHSEHIIIVKEKDIQKTFNVIFNLIHKK